MQRASDNFPEVRDTNIEQRIEFSCSDLLEDISPEDWPEARRIDNPKEETAAIFYTSGSTGDAKGVESSHYQVFNMAGDAFLRTTEEYSVVVQNLRQMDQVAVFLLINCLVKRHTAVQVRAF